MYFLKEFSELSGKSVEIMVSYALYPFSSKVSNKEFQKKMFVIFFSVANKEINYPESVGLISSSFTVLIQKTWFYRMLRVEMTGKVCFTIKQNVFEFLRFVPTFKMQCWFFYSVQHSLFLNTNVFFWNWSRISIIYFLTYFSLLLFNVFLETLDNI